MSEANIEPTDELAQFLSDLEASEINGEITLSWMYRPPMDGQDRRAGRLPCGRQLQIAWRSDELAMEQGDRTVPRERVRETVAPGLSIAQLSALCLLMKLQPIRSHRRMRGWRAIMWMQASCGVVRASSGGSS